MKESKILDIVIDYIEVLKNENKKLKEEIRILTEINTLNELKLEELRKNE